MAITPEIIEEVLYEYNRLKRSPYKTAKFVGITTREVLEIMDEHGHKISPITERYDGYGRPELQQFIVARKLATAVWDNTDPDIAAARDAFEAGTIDMTTGRDGKWLILYAIPRKVVQPRPNYFAPELSI